MAAKSGERLGKVRFRAGAQHRAGLRRRFEHLGGLVVDHAHVAGLGGTRVTGIDQLQHLALGDGVGALRENLQQALITQRHHQLERPGNQEVPHQHAGGVAPDRVHRGPAPAQAGFVHHVVVEQGGGVQKFDHRRHIHVLGAGVAGCSRAQQPHQRAQAFTAGVDDVLPHLADQRYLGVQVVGDEAVHRLEILGDDRADGLEIHEVAIRLKRGGKQRAMLAAGPGQSRKPGHRKVAVKAVSCGLEAHQPLAYTSRPDLIIPRAPKATA